MHTLSNLNIKGRNNVGLSGYINAGQIEGLNINTAIVKGNDNVGTIAGYNDHIGMVQGININNTTVVGNNTIGGIAGTNTNDSVVNEVKITGNVTGYTQVGGGVGYSTTTNAKTTSILSNTNITSTYPTSGSVGIGGIVGSHYYGDVSGIVNGGSITTHTGTYYTGYITGYNVDGTTAGAYVDNISVSGPIASGYNGTIFEADYRNSLEYLSGPLKSDKTSIIESPYTGDKNGSGYFFDYNDAGNDIVVVKVYNPSSVGTAAPKDPVPSGGVGTTSGYGSMTSSFSYVPNPSASDAVVPTCTIDLMQILSNGFYTQITCTDNVEVESIRTLRDASPYTGTYDGTSYEKVGTTKRGSKSADGKTVTLRSRWTTANASGPYPTKGVCYYYSYSARDTSGNYSIYHTPSCYKF